METILIRESIRIACEYFGHKHAPLVVLIPGAGATAEFWPDNFCHTLADSGYRVLRYYHRDTGLSTHFEAPYDIWELHHDLCSLIELAQSPEVNLVGHSMGGFLAQMAVCYSTLSIQSAVSISAASAVDSELCSELGMSQPSEETWKILMQNQPSGNFDSDLDSWLSSWKYLNGSIPFNEELAIHYTKSLYSGDFRNTQVATNHVHAMSTVPVSLVSELTKTNCPFLVLHGTEDALVPFDNGQVTARLIPNSRFIGIEGAGHMFFNEETWSQIRDQVVQHLTGH